MGITARNCTNSETFEMQLKNVESNTKMNVNSNRLTINRRKGEEDL